MKLFTLIENKRNLEKAEIELQLIPGIPQIHFLGLPDQAIKESFLRIKSALKVSGYKFPTTQQLIVNIKPNHLKKSSKGLELAVALGLLHVTGQKVLSSEILKSIIYGELDLNGDVHQPVDLFEYKLKHKDENYLSGLTNRSMDIGYILKDLKSDIEYYQKNNFFKNLVRPQQGLEKNYTGDEAELIFLMALTNLSILLSGPAGSGKTTLVENYRSFLIIDDEKHFHWPTVLAPHSSVTPAAFLGGGAQLYQGEVERAANGVLFLDELLEFNINILESLRGPMTGQNLRLARGSGAREFECQFQVAATTNLCPCGKWTPDLQLRTCRYGNKKCKSTLEKLSGPIFDRFGLFYFYPQKSQKRDISGFKILDRISHQHSQIIRLNNELSDELKKSHSVKNKEIIETYYPAIGVRRAQSLLKVAVQYAAERESGILDLSDLVKAEKWTYSSFIELEKGMS
jgi:magnesium chelatase family protein